MELKKTIGMVFGVFLLFAGITCAGFLPACDLSKGEIGGERCSLSVEQAIEHNLYSQYDGRLIYTGTLKDWVPYVIVGNTDSLPVMSTSRYIRLRG